MTVITDSAESVAGSAPRPGAVRKLLRQPVTLACFGYLVLLAVVAVLAPWIAPYDPMVSNVSVRLQGPSADHWLGTDELGRDVLSRSMYGARVALMASGQAVALALLIGVPLGLVIGYAGGPVDWVTMRLADVEQAIPMLLLAFTFIAIFGRGLSIAMLAVSVSFSTSYARLVRAVVMAEREKLYVVAGWVQGYPVRTVMFRHILPNVSAPIVVQTAILLGVAILIEAMLSFLGLGVDAGTPSWGGMLEDARRFQIAQPMLSLVPGALITATVLVFNMLGDGIRDALSPHASRRRRRRTMPPALPQVTTEGENGTAQVAAGLVAEPLLRVSDLTVRLPRGDGDIEILREVSFDIRPGEIFGLVGESGSGKSMTAQVISGMLPSGGRATGGSVRLDGRELLTMDERQWGAVRGRDIGLLFQDPAAALSPVHTVGMQIAESVRAHTKASKREAWELAASLLERVKIPDARSRLRDYPHQFSGGMAQRALIAAALVCRPKLLIADEPTTALDVTVQAEVLELLRELRSDFDMSVLFITHDLGVIAEVCDRVAVMYAGQIVEVGTVDEVLRAPKHPYTAALLAASPEAEGGGDRLRAIPGAVPPPWNWPDGCRFHTRCPFAVESCATTAPELTGNVRCLRAGELTLTGTA